MSNQDERRRAALDDVRRGLGRLGSLHLAHHVDIIVRMNGLDHRHEGDWIKSLRDALPSPREDGEAEIVVRLTISLTRDEDGTVVYTAGHGTGDFRESGKDLQELKRRIKARVLGFLAQACERGDLTPGGPDVVRFELVMPEG